MHDRPILISFECDHWLDYDYVNGSDPLPLSRACGQCFNGSPLMPDGQKKNMSPIRYLIGQSLYLGSLSHLLSSLYRFSLVDQESECERDWNSYAQPIHTCLLNPMYSDSAATRVVYSFLNPASSRSLHMGMPERKKGYPRFCLPLWKHWEGVGVSADWKVQAVKVKWVLLDTQCHGWIW